MAERESAAAGGNVRQREAAGGVRDGGGKRRRLEAPQGRLQLKWLQGLHGLQLKRLQG